MSRRPTGNGHDPNVLKFRPRPKPRPPRPNWKAPLGMFVGLFALVLGLRALDASLRGLSLGFLDMITPLVFATLVTGVYLYRRR